MLGGAALAVAPPGWMAEAPVGGMPRHFPVQNKFDIAREIEGAPDRRGWYHHSVGIAETGKGLVCTYRLTDAHTGVISDIMVAYSSDGGRSWSGHKRISHSDVWNDRGVWVAPQLSRLRDGRLVLLADFGVRRVGENWPMLTDWQKPSRGMSNHLFWSHDDGRTWDGPHKIDDVGGEPGYILELSDGALVYVRTESQPTGAIWNPPMPWGGNYYRAVAVFSDDGGKSWSRKAIVSEDPHQGDCEVGLVELAPGRLMAVTRVGFGGGRFAQPSRMIFSQDNGRSWGDARLAPFYGQRTIVRKLRSGQLLVTYRESWGRPGTHALVFDPAEKLPYQPSCYLWDESRCTRASGVMRLRTGEGAKQTVMFGLYPAQGPDSVVDVEADLRVEQADADGCGISAGCAVRIGPKRVAFSARPEDGFDLDANQWHHYRVLRDKANVAIFVDGQLRLSRPLQGLESRMVTFGNLSHAQNASLSEWKSVSAVVRNTRDHSIEWKWSAADSYPDQFYRDRVVCLDRCSDNGYSGWCQKSDGGIVIADYTCGNPPTPLPFVRAYVTTEEGLL